MKKVLIIFAGFVLGIILTIGTISIMTWNTQGSAMEAAIKFQLNNQTSQMTKAVSENTTTQQYLQNHKIKTVQINSDAQGNPSLLYYRVNLNGKDTGIDLKKLPSKTLWGSAHYVVTGVKLFKK